MNMGFVCFSYYYYYFFGGLDFFGKWGFFLCWIDGEIGVKMKEFYAQEKLTGFEKVLY